MKDILLPFSFVLVLAGAASVSSCGPSSSSSAATTTTGNVGGQALSVIFDPNKGGEASTVRIEEIRWGRLVDIYDSHDDDGNQGTPSIRTLQNRDFLISDTIFSDGTTYVLETNPFTEQAELTILADADGEDLVVGGTETQAGRFERLRDAATTNLGFVEPTGLDPSVFIPPFPLVPRNAALSIRCSDLLDPSTIQAQTVRVFTGTPPTLAYDARVVPDPNYGALVDVGGVLQFRPTRVIVDFAVSEAEAQLGTAQVNSVGLPPSQTNQLTNVVIRIPTKVDGSLGQFQLLRNLAGHTLDFPRDDSHPESDLSESTPTKNIVRSFRSGRSDPGLTNPDPNNGFLLDVDAPSILGSQPVSVTSVPASVPPDALQGDSPNDSIFLTNIEYGIAGCAQTPRRGDILSMNGTQFAEIFTQVTRQAAPPQNGLASDVRVRLLPIPSGADIADLRTDFLAATTGNFQSVFAPGPGAIPECFLQISPTPGSPPVEGIDLQPQITVRFSEPMDPDSVTPHDTFRLARERSGFPGPAPREMVVAEVTASPDLREFRFSPVTDLRHLGTPPGNIGDEYFFNLVGGSNGVTDLAGNGLNQPLPKDLRLVVDSGLPDSETGGFVLNFDEVDEDHNSSDALDLFPEIRGQFSYDLARGRILPRPVTREARPVDRSGPLFSIMTPTSAPIITPLSPRGSRMQTVWRYADVGFSVLEEGTANIDVEGLSWVPFSGSIATDFFSNFEIQLTHSRRMPEEWVFPVLQGGTGYASYPNSGLGTSFSFNNLKHPSNTTAIVHSREKGYFVTPTKLFTSSSTLGLKLMPYPLNQDIPPEDFEYYTWRDTAVTGKGGSSGFGVELKAFVTVGSLCDVGIPTIYDPGGVRSLGLPLLMDFKCFRDDAAIGLNGLMTSFAVATTRKPVFRVFSTGGNSPTGAPIFVNADLSGQAQGGITPGGVATPGDDNTVMFGQLDFVIRVSRVHSIWHDTRTRGPGFADFLDPIIEPRPDQLPTGTRIQLAFRGATTVTGADVGDARKYDAYGDPLMTRLVAGPNCPSPLVLGSDINSAKFETQSKINVTFFQTAEWRPIHSNDGAKFLQTRITFVSNAATGLTPELSTLAIAYQQR